MFHDFPSDVSEIEAAEFTARLGVAVPVPRIAEAPVALECRHYLTLEVSHRRQLCIGSVVHARPGIIDPKRLRVNLDAYKPVARLFGNLYARLGEKLALKRQSFAEWQAENGVDAAAGRAEPNSRSQRAADADMDGSRTQAACRRCLSVHRKEHCAKVAC
jgi:hypothetical protein